jgi:hypothetical protein
MMPPFLKKAISVLNASLMNIKKERLALNKSIERQRKELATQKHLDKITQDDDIVRSLCKKLEVGGLLTDDEVGTVNEE